MTTKKAFEKLLSSPKLIEKSGIPTATIRQWRKRLADGKVITLNSMETALKTVAIKTPENWTFKKI